MDQPKAQAPQTTSHQVPLAPIADLFKQAWDVLLAQAGRLIQLWFINLVVYIVAIVVLLILAGAYLFVRISSAGYSIRELSSLVDTVSTQDIAAIIVFFIIFASVMTFIGLIYNAAVVLLLGDEKKGQSPINYLKQGIHYAWPLFFTGLLAGLIAIGGLFFFIAPYIIFLEAFCFYTYIVILENKRGMAALQRSASIVFQNFGGILLRLLLLWVAYMAVSMAIAALFSGEGKGEGISGGGIVQFAVSVFLNMYALTYMYVLYRQARKVYVEKPVNLTWVWVIAIVGWLILAGFAAIGYRVFQQERQKNVEKRKFEERIMQNDDEENEYEQQFNSPQQRI